MALSAPRNTPRRGPLLVPEEIKQKTNTVLWNGGIGAIDNTTGYLIPAAAATTLIKPGRIVTAPAVKSDATGIASGVLKVKIEYGTFRYANSASADLIVQADIGKNCYLVDDQTVAKTDDTGARSVAGVVKDIDASGVWVYFAP